MLGVSGERVRKGAVAYDVLTTIDDMGGMVRKREGGEMVVG